MPCVIAEKREAVGDLPFIYHKQKKATSKQA